MLTKDKIVDIRENSIDAEVLTVLLIDRSTTQNILWCTEDYTILGDGYGFHDSIEVNLISGCNDGVIKPRIKRLKSSALERRGKYSPLLGFAIRRTIL